MSGKKLDSIRAFTKDVGGFLESVAKKKTSPEEGRIQLEGLIEKYETKAPEKEEGNQKGNRRR